MYWNLKFYYPYGLDNKIVEIKEVEKIPIFV